MVEIFKFPGSSPKYGRVIEIASDPDEWPVVGGRPAHTPGVGRTCTRSCSAVVN